MSKKFTNMKEPDSGIVHILNPSGGGDFTICGWSFDAPSTEEGRPIMIDTDEVCNCETCILTAKLLLPLLRRELKRVERAALAKTSGEEKAAGGGAGGASGGEALCEGV